MPRAAGTATDKHQKNLIALSMVLKTLSTNFSVFIPFTPPTNAQFGERFIRDTGTVRIQGQGAERLGFRSPSESATSAVDAKKWITGGGDVVPVKTLACRAVSSGA